MIDWSKVVKVGDRPTPQEASARDAIRQRRDEAINGTIYVSTFPVAADQVSQVRLMGAALSAMLDPTYSVQWKGADGVFVTLTAEQIIAAAQAVRAHVQACFDREAALLVDLAAGIPYALDEGWPVQLTKAEAELAARAAARRERLQAE